MPIPIVKTGPNRNKERSRNKDGRWRKKRADAGYKRKLSELTLEILRILEEKEKNGTFGMGSKSDLDDDIF